MMKILAHIRGEPYEEQTLKEHCTKTAKYASEILKSVGLEYTAYLAGILHDFGKATAIFDDYLRKSAGGEKVVRGSVNHTFAGVIYLLERYMDRMKFEEMLTKELIAYAVGAHHGEFDLNFNGETDKSGFEHRLNADRKEIAYEEAKRNYLSEVCSEQKIDEYFEKAVEEITAIVQKLELQNGDFDFYLGLLARLLTSAVMEGDRRDTAEFMLNVKVEKKVGGRELWNRELENFRQNLSKFSIDGHINQVRAEISQVCEDFAEQKEGIYRLNLPTGSGKTLASERYSLAFAKKYNKQRIIFIIPLLSILSQNEKEIRKNLTDENLVFAHHSNMVIEKEDNESPLEKIQREYLKDTWNSEVIVSTFVQFMNLFYTDKTSAIRRMNALIDSVIVIDEVQSMPSKLYKLFMLAIHFLREFCGATVILSSATQPCFDELMKTLAQENACDDLEEDELQAYQKQFQYEDMVVLSDEQKSVFKRANIVDCITPNGRDWDEFIMLIDDIMESHSSTLVICNTKAEARKLFRDLERNSDYELYHLSTSMCTKHIDSTLTDIKEQLKKAQQHETNKKIVCISTQLVEAGVDFSFQSVIRVLSGFDNLAQSAGRCNRGGEYGSYENANVFFVNLKNEKLGNLEFIKTSQAIAQNIVLDCQEGHHDEKDWLSDEMITLYYQGLFHRDGIVRDAQYYIRENGMEYSICDLLDTNETNIPSGLDKYILNQAFKTANEHFTVFDNEKEDILVPYGKGEEILHLLLSDDAKQKVKSDIQWIKHLLNEAKPYTVSVYSDEKEKLIKNRLLRADENKLFYYLTNKKTYDEKIGLSAEKVSDDTEIL